MSDISTLVTEYSNNEQRIKEAKEWLRKAGSDLSWLGSHILHTTDIIVVTDTAFRSQYSKENIPFDTLTTLAENLQTFKAAVK